MTLTNVGSQALARAVYSRKRLILLDDVFGGPDHKASGLVMQNLLGDLGLLRSPEHTVVLATNRGKYSQ